MLLELKVVNPQGSGTMNIRLPSKKLTAVVKEPLQPVIALAMPDGSLMPCVQGGDYSTFDALQEKLGLPAFDTLKGGKVLVNFDHVMFYTAGEELGSYALIMGSGFGTVVKTTEKALKEHLGEESSSIIT